MNILSQMRKRWALIVAVLILIFVVFAPILQNEFTNWDDGVILVDNREIKDPSPEAWGKIFQKNYVGTYIPLTIAMFKVEYSLWRERPFGYFFNNLLLHLVVVLLVYALGLRMGLSLIGAGAAALIFGIHPMHVESVAWISQRKDVLCGLFYLGAVLLYLRYRDGSKAAYLGAMVCAALSILAKPMAYSLPAIFFLLDFSQRRKFAKGMLLDKLPFFAVIGAVSWMTFAAHPQESSLMWGQKVLLWSYTAAFHLGKFFYPNVLLPAYEMPSPVVLGHPDYSFAFWACVGLTALSVIFRRNKWVMFALGWYLISNAMIIIRAVWDFGNNTVVADRFMYLPSLGICLALGALIEWGVRLSKNKGNGWAFALRGLLILGVLGLSFLSWRQTTIWKNNTTLWSHLIRHAPHRVIGYQNRSAGYREKKEFGLALADIETAIRLSPDNPNLLYARAMILDESGQSADAIPDLDRALALNPRYGDAYHLRGKIHQETWGDLEGALRDYAKAVEYQEYPDRAYYNRGIIYDQLGQKDLALEDYGEVIRFNPVHPEVYNNRAALLIEAGKLDAAERDLVRAIRLNPINAQAHANLGAVYLGRGEITKAEVSFSRALEIEPDFSDGYVNRAVLFAMSGRAQPALDDLARALALSPNNANAYATRALLNYNLGRSEDAALDLERLIAIDPGHQQIGPLRNFIKP